MNIDTLCLLKYIKNNDVEVKHFQVSNFDKDEFARNIWKNIQI